MTRAKGFANGNGTVQLGADCSIWYLRLASTLPSSSSIIASFTTAAQADASAMTAKNFSLTGSGVAVEATAGLANDAANAGSLDAATSNIACLRVRGIASETHVTTALTPTASWAIFASVTSAASGGDTEMGVRGEWIISTGTGAASAPTGGAGAVDHASAYVAFRELTAVPFNRGYVVG
jgi:hypothetical protein